MDPLEQAKNYDQIAAHWDSGSFNRLNGIKQHQRALNLSKKSGKAIDIGCGSSGRIIDLLVKQGFNAEELDLSSEMLKLARQHHPDITFHHVDVCTWEAKNKYDFISAWDSIWHVPLDHQALVLRKLFDALADGGIIIFTTGAVDKAGQGSNSFLGQELYHAALGVPSILELLAGSGCVCRHLENDDWPDRHLYIIGEKIARY